jgi:hypothetical protein
MTTPGEIWLTVDRLQGYSVRCVADVAFTLYMRATVETTIEVGIAIRSACSHPLGASSEVMLDDPDLVG